jgi:hypothetical protein
MSELVRVCSLNEYESKEMSRGYNESEDGWVNM